MAYIKADYIQQRLREVLEDAAGTLRTIASTRFEGGLYEGLPVPASSLRALDKPIVESRIVGTERHEFGYTVIADKRLLRILVRVQVVRAATLAEKLSDDTRDTLTALAVEDADVICQALEYPGNLTQTSDANATNLVSGRLQYVSSDIAVEFDGETSARIVSTHNFTGDALITQATS